MSFTKCVFTAWWLYCVTVSVSSLHWVWTAFLNAGPCWATAWSEPTYQTPSSHKEALTASPQGFHWRWWASAKAAWCWTRWSTSWPGPAQTRRCRPLLNASRTCTGWTAGTREAARPGWRASRCWRNLLPAECRFMPTWPLTRCATRCGPGWAVSTDTSLRPSRSMGPVQVRSCTLRTSPPPSRTTSGSSRSFELGLDWSWALQTQHTRVWADYLNFTERFWLFIKNTDRVSYSLVLPHFSMI